MSSTSSSNTLANISIHQTGESSPISEVSVVDINNQTESEITKTLDQKPVPSGFTRLYRGIGDEYTPNRGQNCFSPDIDTAINYARNSGDASGSNNVKLIVIDVPTATLDDLRAYERLHAAIGLSFDVWGKTTGHVVDIPLDWTNGQKPNAEFLRDIKGVGEPVTLLGRTTMESLFDLMGKKTETEHRIATEYFAEHGRGSTPDWREIFSHHPETQKITSAIAELFETEKNELVKIAEGIPALSDAAKALSHINSVGALKASAAGLVGALPAIYETIKAASEQEDAVSASAVTAESALEFLTGASAAIAADAYLIPMLSNPYGAATVLAGEVVAGAAGSQVAKVAMDGVKWAWQEIAVTPLREQSEARAQEKAQQQAQEKQAQEQHKLAQREANPEHYATLDKIPDEPPARKALTPADANAMLERLIAENALKNGWSPTSIKDAIHVGTNHFNSNNLSEQPQSLAAATTPQDTGFAM